MDVPCRRHYYLYYNHGLIFVQIFYYYTTFLNIEGTVPICMVCTYFVQFFRCLDDGFDVLNVLICYSLVSFLLVCFVFSVWSLQLRRHCLFKIDTDTFSEMY